MKKCNVCGSQNPDNSTVCQSCKKPLEGTKRRAMELPIIYSILLLVILGVVLTRKNWAPFVSNLGKMPPTAQMKIVYNWANASIGNTGLSIDSPVELKPKFLKLPDNVKPLIQEMVTYGFSSFPLSIDAVSVIYSGRVTPNLQGAEQGAISNFSNLPSVKDVQYVSKPINPSGKKGSLLDGTFMTGRYKMGFKAAIIIENLNMWQVIVVYNIADNEATDAANRIISSIKVAK